MSFPAVPLDLDCEIDLAGTWTDVSSYVYQRDGTAPPVTLTRGRADESGQCNPSSAAWEWNNRDGRFSPKNPLSPYYGLLGRNTPVRFSIPAQANYLRLEADDNDRAFVNENSRLDISGSIEMRIQLSLTGWAQSVLAAKWDGSPASWAWQLDSDGTMEFTWWDGSAQRSVTSTLPVPAVRGMRALRVTMNASTGTVTFYAAASIDGTYAQLGSAASGTGGASTSIATGTAPLVVGWSLNFANQQNLQGAVSEYRLYNGIGGTVAADAVFSAQAAGTTTWTDTPGNTWSISGGAEISSRDYRYHGLMSAQPPTWDVTGNDMAVKATAGGPLRLLGQGNSPVQSPMQRAELAQAGSLFPVAYWPCEDAAGATSLGSATGGFPMTFDGNPAPVLATDSSFLASAPLLKLNGTRMHGRVAPYSGSSAAVARFLAKLPTVPSSGSQILLRLFCSGATCHELRLSVYNAGGLGLSGWDSTGANVFDTGGVAFAVTGLPLWYSIEATPVAGGQQYAIVTLAPGASSGSSFSATVSGGVHGTIADCWVNPSAWFTDTIFGHLSVQGAWASLFNLGQPLNAWQGEAAGDRFARLAAENGWQARVYGAPDTTAAMGPQGIDTLGNLLQEVETADRGLIYEPRQCLALGYRTLASMLNQSPAVTLSYTASEPGGADGNPSDSGLDPTYDDLLTRNDWTLTRGNSGTSSVTGATVQVQLDDGSAMSISAPTASPPGVGDYADTKTVNVQADSQLNDVAGWMVHVGTVDEARWPQIPVNLARSEIIGNSLYYPVADADVGDCVQVTSVPDVVLFDPVKQLVYGTTEALGGMHHVIAWNEVPESPYEVMVLDDPVYGRADTDGSTLAGSVSSSATSLSVATDAGFPPWTTAAADFPFDIAIAGEQITVTNITGASSPQSFTVTRSVNGVSKAQSAGADVRLWFPPIISLT